ncbi:YjbE family putative metal transport protein [Clostridium folliculivorans]|uniref:Membrane protein n=1 Tax=Clostridium folliculivorans TaxID=2886038 RepID=A0A9W5Y269_9CLOT|nr:YjbE family putative metal transport protein [Clostridium folliculivorans]GKU25359.1 membrane protein [Clostridium folliculivorans]GKU28380.1 membrane protein [Clostridium folliculivorans]
MYTFSELISKGIEIFFINLVLSGDNVGVIALAIKDLPPKKAKLANIMGVWVALFLRIFFVGIIGFLYTLDWLHINIIGAILLLYITFNMIQDQGKGVRAKSGQTGGFFKAIISITVADISMSLDNVLAIVSIAMTDTEKITGQQMGLVIFGLMICMPIIFWGSEFIAEMMVRFPVIIYMCAALLVYTAVKMIFDDKLVSGAINNINPALGLIFSILCALAVLVYGIENL